MDRPSRTAFIRRDESGIMSDAVRANRDDRGSMRQTKFDRRLDLLTSWKEIASFMGKGVRTVQRWEATLGLPVIRPSDRRSGIVMARPSDLEAWILNGRQRLQRKLDGQSTNENDVRAAFAGCIEELRRCSTEVRTLCNEVGAARQSLRGEVSRLKALCQEWNALRDRVLNEPEPTLREENPSRSTRLN